METITNAIAPVRHYVKGATMVAAFTDLAYVIPTVKLIGSDLLAFVADHTDKFPSRSDLVAASGYVKEGGKLSFIGFYENLLEAKLAANPDYLQPASQDEDEEYDALSPELQALYDAVHSKFGDKWDHEEIMGMIEQLGDIGIETVEQLEERHYGTIDNVWNWEAEFAEECALEMEYGLRDSIVYSAINWQDLWDHNLRYDFDYFEYDGEAHIFRQA